jgi:hypothetical protein
VGAPLDKSEAVCLADGFCGTSRNGLRAAVAVLVGGGEAGIGGIDLESGVTKQGSSLTAPSQEQSGGD